MSENDNFASTRENIESIKQSFESKQINLVHTVVLTVGVVLGVVFISTFLGPPTEPVETVEENNSVNLTDYQQEYVDCPTEYLELCTSLSKMPTEEISFWKKENDRLYFILGDGRAMTSTVPSKNSSGEFVTYMSAEEVNTAMNKTE